MLNAPDPSTWTGQRDAVLLAVLYNTGARVSELASLRVADLLLDRQIAVQLHGKDANAGSCRCGSSHRATTVMSTPDWRPVALPLVDSSPRM